MLGRELRDFLMLQSYRGISRTSGVDTEQNWQNHTRKKERSGTFVVLTRPPANQKHAHHSGQLARQEQTDCAAIKKTHPPHVLENQKKKKRRILEKKIIIITKVVKKVTEPRYRNSRTYARS